VVGGDRRFTGKLYKAKKGEVAGVNVGKRHREFKLMERGVTEGKKMNAKGIQEKGEMNTTRSRGQTKRFV